MDENELFATYEHKFTIRASRISRSPNIDEYRLNYAGCKSKSSVHEQTKKHNIRTMQYTPCSSYAREPINLNDNCVVRLGVRLTHHCSF